MTLDVTLFTDPACPFAFSAEPVRRQLAWHYGDGLRWRLRMIVLTREAGEAENLASGVAGLQRRFGMPIDPARKTRAASSEPACRVVVAARLHAPEREARLLRALRVRVFAAADALLDDPALIAAAARDAGLDPDDLRAWSDGADVAAALEGDVRAARAPTAGARARDHKLGGPSDERRYTAPSYEFTDPATSRSIAVAGMNPIEAYEVAIAALHPELRRRAAPASAVEALAWAGEPLATAELVALTGAAEAQVRSELARVARFDPAGADGYWRLPAQ